MHLRHTLDLTNQITENEFLVTEDFKQYVFEKSIFD